MRPGKPGWEFDWPFMISLMVMRECSSSTGPVGVGGLDGWPAGVVVPDAPLILTGRAGRGSFLKWNSESRTALRACAVSMFWVVRGMGM